MLATLFNSPPKTRWSNCFAACWETSAMTLRSAQDSQSRRREAFIPKEFSKCRVPVPSGRDQCPVPWHRTIIGDAAAPDRCKHAARFVHQKIGSRKVPVVTVGTGDCDVAIALRNLRQTQRQRTHARNHGERGFPHAQAVHKLAWPSDARS